MSPTYSFDIDVVRNLVRITMAGFFRPDDVISFQQARDGAYRQLICRPNDRLTLVDIRGMHIQSQEAVAICHYHPSNQQRVEAVPCCYTSCRRHDHLLDFKAWLLCPA